MRREVKWTLTVVLVLLLGELFVLPRLGGGRHALRLLAHFNLAIALTALAIEAAALVAFAQLTYTVLPPGILRRRTIMQIDLSSLAFSHIMPGGTAFGAALMYRLFTKQGVRAADAGFAIAMQGVGSAVVLNVIFWLALLVSLFFHGYNPLYAVAAGLGVLLMASFAGVVVLLTKGRVKAVDLLRRIADRLPFVDGERMAIGLEHFAERLRVFASHRNLLRQAVGWAAANWLLDAACLWVFIAAFHVYVSPVDLLVAYGLANILAVIPITPSGLGVVEAVLIPTLHGFGVPLSVASLAVIGYRLVNFWLPIPVGGVAYLSLRFSGVGWRDRVREIRREMSVGRELAMPGGDADAGVGPSTATGTPGAPAVVGPVPADSTASDADASDDATPAPSPGPRAGPSSGTDTHHRRSRAGSGPWRPGSGGSPAHPAHP
jgi:uncharacterized protein (TIRG00374 family)